MSAYIIPNTVKCKFCPRWRSREAMARGDEKEGYTCPTCYHEQANQLMRLAQNAVKAECSDCHISQAEVQRRGQLMKMHRKDKTWAFLCPACSARYEPKAGIYDRTLYGLKTKLAGHK